MLTVSDGMLHIEAERREEEKREEKGHVRQEVRYGSLSRSLPLPAGVIEADITATYKVGVLEIRVPEPKRESAKKTWERAALDRPDPVSSKAGNELSRRFASPWCCAGLPTRAASAEWTRQIACCGSGGCSATPTMSCTR